MPLKLYQAKTITFPREVETVFIAQPGVASYQLVNSRKVIVFGAFPGETTLVAIDKAGETAWEGTVRVNYDTLAMTKALRASYPKFKLEAVPLMDGIALRGKVETAQQAADILAFADSLLQINPMMAQQAAPAEMQSQGAQGGQGGQGGDEASGAAQGKGTMGAKVGKVINQLTVTTPNQVTVRVRIAEVSRKLTDQLGFQWGAQYKGARSSFQFAGNDVLGAVTGVDAENPFNFTFSSIMDALAKEELVSILAEPNLTVVSGETASFIAGGQMPFLTYSNDEANVEFKDYGVLLSVTPTILSGSRISLRVRPEVSEPSESNGITFQGIQQDGFIVRRAETTIELASGQSFAIAGLLKNDFNNTTSKVPGIGDVPVLGALARSKAFERGETELVIVATAYISEPSGEPYSLPNEEVYVPNVFARFFLNADPEVSTASTLPRGSTAVRPVGNDFIL